jgi:Ni,Fe-hydrogenase III large subunit
VDTFLSSLSDHGTVYTRGEAAGEEAVTIGVPPLDLPAVARRLTGPGGARLADMFADDSGGDGIILRMIWAVDGGRGPGSRYLITESAIEGPYYPEVSDVTPAAFVEECEIYEQFGIASATGKPTNRVMMPPQDGYRLPRLGRQPPSPPQDAHAPHTVGGQAFEFPFGPVRQAGVETLYYGLVTSGEEVVDLYLFTWHKHRGVEWRLRGRTPQQAAFFVERIEGLSAVAAGWSFAAAVEAALGISVPPAVARTRAVALELERLYNHAAAVAALCQATGLTVGQSAAEIALERLLRLNAATFGHRYLFGIVEPGGARRGPDVDLLRRDLPGAYEEFRRATGALLQTNSFLDRLEATGILTADQGRQLGLVGPVARASGLAIDGRIRPRARAGPPPGNPYGSIPVRVAAGTGGDALARFNVLLAETAEAVRLIGEFLDAGTGAGVTPLPVAPPADGGGRCGLGSAESPRGEVLAWVALDDSGRIARARLRPASARNWRGFDDACRSQNVFTDIPIIEASFWLTVAGMAR